MSDPPDFRELVGDEGTPEELEQLRRAHDLLIAAGPPPELSPADRRGAQDAAAPGAMAAPAARGAAFLLAAGVAAAAFGIGFLVGDRGSSGSSRTWARRSRCTRRSGSTARRAPRS